jgi:hypothetical protein
VNNVFETAPGLEKVSLQPYQQRLVEEGAELFTRVKALEQFLGKGAPGASPNEQALLYAQLSAMKKYHDALFQRTVLWAREGKLKNPMEAT